MIIRLILLVTLLVQCTVGKGEAMGCWAEDGSRVVGCLLRVEGGVSLRYHGCSADSAYACMMNSSVHGEFATEAGERRRDASRHIRGGTQE